jgi:hypothetical protein
VRCNWRSCGGEDCCDFLCGCSCHGAHGDEWLEPVKRTYDADELGIDQEEDD